ncbi:class I adenylate-forming enzyme family protein [Streptomyces sp. Tue6028]|uniref:class I adenylate-forming enzyme family protein n=1 Tax=Streptomyces sp. Tue6028 TaxID=2036037 RepID=UPI003D715B44
MPRIPVRRSGLYLGVVAEHAAAKNAGTPLTLDHDLDVLPGTGREFTVAALAEHVDDMAARLWAAGVRPGAHVALHKTSNFDIYILASGASRIGAVPVMLSPALPGESVAALLGRLKRPYLVTDAAKLDGSLADVPLDGLTERIVLAAGHRAGTVSLTDLAGAPRQKPVFNDPDRPALMTHTSGTTGLPKLVVHSARTLRGRFRPQNRLAGLIRKRETVAVHVSFVHSRMFLAMAVLLPRAFPVVLMEHGDPERTAELFARTRPGFLETHPNSFLEWEEIADDPRRPFANVKYFSSTFDAIHPGTMDRLLKASERRSPLFFQIYGQSECGPLVGRGYTRRNAHKANGRCLGYAMPGITRFRLTGRGGKRPSKANPGYIDVYTPGRAVTYYGEKERFEKQAIGDWWRGMDIGYRSKWGCLHLLDREVDHIPGVHSTLEVEDAVLARLPELTELVLVPGPRQEPVPVVSTRKDLPLDPERWRAAAADYPQLAAPVQLPLSELPRTATMKVQRIELARRLQEQT